MNVVDLTEDCDEELPPLPPPPRCLTLPSLPTLPLPSISLYSAASAPNFSQQTPLRGPWPTIRLSLVNTKEFTAKASCTVSKEVISTIKLVSGVRFDSKQRQFVFPIESHSQLVSALGALQVHVEPLPQESRNRLTLQKKMESSFCSDEFERVLQEKLPLKLRDSLASFQRDGVRFVYKNKGRAIIADEMGLGKTIQAIACACLYRESWPVLVVSPSSARHHWKMELETWLCPEACSSDDIAIIDSPSKTRIILHKPHKFAIISYNYLTKLQEELTEKNYKMIIIDESHFLKNGKAKRTKSMNVIVEGAARVVLLTGTPALSRPYELFTQLHLIAPMSWDSEQNFCRRYCRGRGPGTTSFVWGESKVGASNTKELHATLFGTIMIRRLKKDTLTELPPKTRNLVRIEVKDEEKREDLKNILKLIAINKSKKDKYGAKNNALNEILENSTLPTSLSPKNTELMQNNNSVPDAVEDLPSSNSEQVPDFSLPASEYPVVQRTQDVSEISSLPMDNDCEPPTKRMLLMELFNKSGIAKVDMFLNHVEEFLADPVSGKLLIFAHHKNVLDRVSTYLSRRSTDYIRIDGSTASKARHQKMLQFQSVPHCRVAVLAITAAGVAITLTAARTVFFAELFWTPGSMLQAEDRVHRIGQLSPVHVTYFVGTDTVDNILWPLVQKKMKTLGEVFQGEKNVEIVVSEEKGGSAAAKELVGIVEDISVEEEQKLLRKEVELDDDAYADIDSENRSEKETFNNGVLDNNISVNNSVNEYSSDNDQELHEYDGLAQAMLSPPKTGDLEYVTVDERDEGTIFCSSKQKQSIIIDLIDEGELPTPVAKSDNKSSNNYTCIDLEADEGKEQMNGTNDSSAFNASLINDVPLSGNYIGDNVEIESLANVRKIVEQSVDKCKRKADELLLQGNPPHPSAETNSAQHYPPILQISSPKLSDVQNIMIDNTTSSPEKNSIKKPRTERDDSDESGGNHLQGAQCIKETAVFPSSSELEQTVSSQCTNDLSIDDLIATSITGEDLIEKDLLSPNADSIEL